MVEYYCMDKKKKESKKEIYRVFIGLHRISPQSVAYSTVVQTSNREIYSNSHRIAESARSKTIGNHRVNLLAIESFLNDFTKDKHGRCTVKIYCKDDFVGFEYNSEYLKDKSFSPDTRDMDVWNRIVAVIEDKKIDVIIDDGSSVLGGIVGL